MHAVKTLHFPLDSLRLWAFIPTVAATGNILWSENAGTTCSGHRIGCLGGSVAPEKRADGAPGSQYSRGEFTMPEDHKTAQPVCLMTPKELAQELNVSRAWIRDHASGRRRPVPPSINLGTQQHPQYRFERKAVQEWLNQLAKKS